MDHSRPAYRRPVLFDPAEEIAETAMASPDEWFLVGGGEHARLGSMTQTAWRIRRGLLAAFVGRPGGMFEVRVTAAANRPNAEYDVEMYLRWVPVAKREE